MSRIPLLPRWVLPSVASIYDLESATISEMVPKLYGTMRDMVNNYNEFAEELNEEIRNFTGSTSEEIANFKKSIEERLRCKFNDLDANLAKIRLDMKQYTDTTLSRAFDVFGVTVKATGEDLILTDATDEEIRALSIYGKTTQRWDPVPEYPADLQSVGDAGSVTVKITNGTDEQLLTIATPEGLPGIKVPKGGNYTDANGQQWICDVIDLKRGVYVQRIDKMKLTGKETITGGSSWAAGCFAIYTKDKNPVHVHGEMMCSFLPMHSNADLASGKYEYGIGTHGEPNLMVRFGADKTEAQTRELWQKAIQDGGRVYTILQDPVERPLTTAELAAYKQLHTYKPDTTISNGSGAGMMIEYVCITQKYIENHIHDTAVRITTEMVNDAIRNGQIVVGLEYNEETEEANIIVGGAE